MERSTEAWTLARSNRSCHFGKSTYITLFVVESRASGAFLSGYKKVLGTIQTLHFLLPAVLSLCSPFFTMLTRLLLCSSNESSVTLRELGSLASVILVLFALLYRLLHVPVTASPKHGHSPPTLQLPSWKITQSFFEKRFDFIQHGFKATSSFIYQTTLFRHDAIVLSGDKGRQIFFKEKGLDLYDTFSIMMGSVR